jgi:DNA replication protein DnaC
MSFEQETKAAMDSIDAEIASIDAVMPTRVPGWLSSQSRLADYKARLAAWVAANPETNSRREALLAESETRRMALFGARTAALQAERQHKRMLELGIGSRTAESLVDPKETQALREAKAWTDGWALVLIGGVGSGKTVAAAWLASDALGKKQTVEWVATLQASRSSAFGPESEARERAWMRADLLVVDDAGAEFASDAWRSILAAVLDARWGNNLRTVITSNLKLAELKERLGARTMDRIAQDGRVVACGDVSLRRAP